MPTVQRAELIAVGTELLLGEIVDTNTAFLARALAEQSVDVFWSQRVGDNRHRIADALRSAVARNDLVVTCGGLGPTDDDLTREAIADVLGEPVTVDAELEATLRRRFARFARRMPEGNLKQAWLIASAQALPNPVGTAPGWFVRTEVAGAARVIAALPGPPAELVPMWRDQVVPRLRFPSASFRAEVVKTFGIGESHVAERLRGLTDAANPSVATYAKRDGVHVRVAAKAADRAAATALLAPVVQEVRERLEGFVWGSDDEELPVLVLRALHDRGLRLAIVDAATGGALADTLGAVDFGAAVLLGPGPLVSAVIAWRDEALADLGVARTEPASCAPVDDVDAVAVATHLAERSRARRAADYVVAVAPWRMTTTEGAPGHAAWRSAWAVTGPSGTEARAVTVPETGHASRRERMAFAALVALWTQLKST